MIRDVILTASAERYGPAVPVVTVSTEPKAPEEPTPFQQEWKRMLERVRGEAAPHRFTFAGQHLPWIDPLPPPDEDLPYDGPMGLCPHLMLRHVRAVQRAHGHARAAALLERAAEQIGTLESAGWNRRLDEERRTLNAVR